MAKAYSVALTLALALCSPEAAQALTHEAPPSSLDHSNDPEQTSESSIEDIIAGSAVIEDAEQIAAQRADWALQAVLRDGFAHTPSVEAMVQRAIERGIRAPAARPWQNLARLRRLRESLQPGASHEEVDAFAASFDIPLVEHPLVDMYVDYFTGKGRWFFKKWLGRAERYIPIMQPILEEKGLPKDLVYLAMIESGFSAKAVSVAAACGYWQFIRSTARLFNLDMDFWIDERRDFVRATEAAASFLSQLYERFGDWHLAWAGYNAGGGRVSRALQRYDATDYWELVDDKKGLARETRHYVAKIIAAAIVAKNRERFGFSEVEPLSPLLFDEVEVEGAVELRLVAKRLGTNVQSLRELNPALLRDVTPPGRHYRLRVPKGYGASVASWIEELPRSKRVTYARHTVRRGDTLYGIASQYSTTMAAIRDFNRIRNPHALRIGQEVVIPTLRGSRPVTSKASPHETERSERVARRAEKPERSRHHVVSAGETLWSISQRYGISVDHLKKSNGLRDNRILVGAKLRIR